MQKRKIELSIIIVSYKAEKELFDCLESITKSAPAILYEVIVVDNDDEQEKLEGELKKRFPNVIYIKSLRNIGFSVANNRGAKVAKGNFLFFLNPDTVVFPKSIESLLTFMQSNDELGIAAPLPLDKNGKPYLRQGTLELTPLRGTIVLSFIDEYFPNNSISKIFWLSDWDRKSVREVDVIPGAAFMIQKDIFDKVGGFDKNFFLYFEENDLCRRVKRLGYKIYMFPQAKIIHLGARSTKNKYIVAFSQSRFYYFKKNFGLVSALLVHLMTSIRNPIRYFNAWKAK